MNAYNIDFLVGFKNHKFKFLLKPEIIFFNDSNNIHTMIVKTYLKNIESYLLKNQANNNQIKYLNSIIYFFENKNYSDEILSNLILKSNSSAFDEKIFDELKITFEKLYELSAIYEFSKIFKEYNIKFYNNSDNPDFYLKIDNRIFDFEVSTSLSSKKMKQLKKFKIRHPDHKLFLINPFKSGKNMIKFDLNEIFERGYKMFINYMIEDFKKIDKF